MGSKDISLRQGLVTSKVDQWIDSALNRGGAGAGDNSSDNHSTVEEMLHHPQVKKHGTFGRLSASQQNIVTSVVSVMQDKVSNDAKNNAETLKEIILAEREALKAMSHSFASTAKSLYKLPLIASVRKSEDEAFRDVVSDNRSFHKDEPAEYAEQETVAESNRTKKAGHWSRYISWGNMISITAIVLLVLVVKTSVETANFETQYHNAISEVDGLELTLEAKDKKYDGLQSELQLANMRIASLESDLEGQKKNAEQQQTNLLTSLDKQEKQIAKLEQLSASTQYSLNGEIKALQTELAMLKGKESDQSQKSEIWKHLAQERKEELTKLQSQIITLSELSRDAKAANSDESSWSLF